LGRRLSAMASQAAAAGMRLRSASYGVTRGKCMIVAFGVEYSLC
jgi:hypothetical protein